MYYTTMIQMNMGMGSGMGVMCCMFTCEKLNDLLSV